MQDQANSQQINKSTLPIIEELKIPPVAHFTSQLLLDALYFIWDGAERSQTQMFLIGDTAKQVREDEDLTGDKITVGIRRNEWFSGQGRIFQDFCKHELGGWENNNEVLVVYKFHDVPIHIKIYDENPTLSSFDTVFYRYETFSLPNPYSVFKEEYENS